MTNTEKDIVVIFGDVEASAYTHLLNAMLREGLHPEVVRINPDANESNVRQIIFDHHDFDPDSDSIPPILEANVSEALNRLTRNIFKDTSLSQVKACVFPDEGYSESFAKWQWLVSRFNDDIAEYVVQTNESDGTPYLKGHGFGESLPLVGAALEDYKSDIFMGALAAIDDM